MAPTEEDDEPTPAPTEGEPDVPTWDPPNNVPRMPPQYRPVAPPPKPPPTIYTAGGVPQGARGL